jgi:hypothetical protein
MTSQHTEAQKRASQIGPTVAKKNVQVVVVSLFVCAGKLYNLGLDGVVTGWFFLGGHTRSFIVREASAVKKCVFVFERARLVCC